MGVTIMSKTVTPSKLSLYTKVFWEKRKHHVTVSGRQERTNKKKKKKNNNSQDILFLLQNCFFDIDMFPERKNTNIVDIEYFETNL